MNKTAIIIPSRMSASRLAGKPLLKINNLPIICHVVHKAQEANIGEVYVATEDQEIVDVVKENGGKAVLTGKHATGSDRIFEGYKKLNLLNSKSYYEEFCDIILTNRKLRRMILQKLIILIFQNL